MNTRKCKALIVFLIVLVTMAGCLVRIVSPNPNEALPQTDEMYRDSSRG